VRLRNILAGLAAACCCAAVQAGGEHERRLAAELVVMAGDTRRLTAREGGPLEREGLVKRLNGALASLPLQLRRVNGDPKSVAVMRDSLARRDWRALSTALATLKRAHAFDARSLLVPTPTPEMLQLGASIHQTTCAGCHDAATGDSLLPAKNLAAQLASMPREEFAARLLLGVRGDRTTALRNPFSDSELAALIAHYSKQISRNNQPEGVKQ
jgi:mono/diheme cytochrome c family protein